MTYQEAFDWIGENMDLDPNESYADFLARLRDAFSNAPELINTLDNGVLLERTEFGKTVSYQLTLEEFFEQLKPAT